MGHVDGGPPGRDNAHRFALKWWSQAAIDNYLRVLDALARVGLTAFTTLHHFTVPGWFAERGGRAAPDAVDLFARWNRR